MIALVDTKLVRASLWLLAHVPGPWRRWAILEILKLDVSRSARTAHTVH